MENLVGILIIPVVAEFQCKAQEIPLTCSNLDLLLQMHSTMKLCNES
jgi:hypothetical protein